MRVGFFQKARTTKFEFQGEQFELDETGKLEFKNEKGESVIEFTGLATDGREDLSIAKATYEAGGSSDIHYHEDRVEHYFIKEGLAEVSLNDSIHILSAGENIEIPAKAHHQARNISPDQGQLILIVTCQPAWIPDDFHLTEAITASSHSSK